MAFQFVVLATILAATNAGVVPAAPAVYAAQAAPLAYATHSVPVAKAVIAKTVDPDFDPNPQYSYAYDVQDGLTGDNKQHHETRNGDVVEGSYSFVEADGSRRIVHYTADSVNGFNAVVDKEPAAVAIKTVAKVAAPVPVTYTAPTIAHTAPVAYAAPAVAKVVAPNTYTNYATPVVHNIATPVVHNIATPVVHNIATPVVHNVATPVAYTNYAAPAVAKFTAPVSYAAPAYYH